MKQQNEKQKLKALVRELEHELSQGKDQLETLEETHERLQQAERICHELVDENQRLREEITEWQGRVAASEDSQKQIGILKQQLEALQAEREALAQSHRDTSERESEAPSSSLDNHSAKLVAPQTAEKTVAVLSSDLTKSVNVSGNDQGPSTSPAKETRLGRLLASLIAQKWRFVAIFASSIIVITLATITIKTLTSESPSSTTQADTETATPEQRPSPVAPRSSIAAEPRVQGTFQTVRPTHVFSEPTEDSALVASIDKGVRLNVVDSREGWLEIRSKHGRPPGFIRKEEAIRIGSN
jgi:hypothetical protein